MNDVFDPTFSVYSSGILSNIDIEKSLNSVIIYFANSDRYTNEDAGIILIGHRPRFCIHWPGMEGVLRKPWEGVLRGGSVRGGRLSGRGARLLIQR